MTRTVAGFALAILFLTACGTAEDGEETSVTIGSNGSNAARGADTKTVNCGGSLYELSELADAPPASSLPDGPTGAVDDVGAPAFDPSRDWKVVHQSDDRVDLVRELDEPLDMGRGDIRTHASRTLQRVTGATNVPDGTWLLTSSGPCAQRLVADEDIGDADLTLADAPSPSDTSIDLLVHERACASGQSAEGRIRLLQLSETAEQIRLRIGVRPPGGNSQTCPANPPTAFTVELSEPLGGRETVDVSVVPPRPVTSIGDG